MSKVQRSKKRNKYNQDYCIFYMAKKREAGNQSGLWGQNPSLLHAYSLLQISNSKTSIDICQMNESINELMSMHLFHLYIKPCSYLKKIQNHTSNYSIFSINLYFLFGDTYFMQIVKIIFKKKVNMNSTVSANKRTMKVQKKGRNEKIVKDTDGEHTRVGECLKILGT